MPFHSYPQFSHSIGHDHFVTERFLVIKKKVQRNNEELFNIFKELRDRYADGGLGIDYGAMLVLA